MNNFIVIIIFSLIIFSCNTYPNRETKKINFELINKHSSKDSIRIYGNIMLINEEEEDKKVFIYYNKELYDYTDTLRIEDKKVFFRNKQLIKKEKIYFHKNYDKALYKYILKDNQYPYIDGEFIISDDLGIISFHFYNSNYIVKYYPNELFNYHENIRQNTFFK